MKIFFGLLFLVSVIAWNSQASAQGFFGQVIETVCGNCGAGDALDDLHDNLGNPLDVVDQIVDEANVEIWGPALGEAIRHSRNDARAAGVLPIPPEIEFVLARYFPQSVFSDVRYRVGSSGELNVATNSIRYGHASAVALIDTIVFANEAGVRDPCLWVHEVFHVQQFRQWGVTDFGKRYVRSLGRDDGAVEGPAYAIQERCSNEISGILASFAASVDDVGGITETFAGNWMYVGRMLDGGWIERNFNWAGASGLPSPGDVLAARVDVNIREDHIRFFNDTGWTNARSVGVISTGEMALIDRVIDVTGGQGFIWVRIGN